MKKMRQAHLWIGLIASVLIFMESLTGLIMNEPWLIGMSQTEGGKGNFQMGQFTQGEGRQGMMGDFGQGSGQIQGQTGDQNSGWAGKQGKGQFQASPGFGGNGNFAPGFRGEGMEQGSLMGIIKGLHEGVIGTLNIKWLIDLTAIAMMFLTGSGIYLSMKILRAKSKKKKRQEEILV
jgi:hypothetical protein